MTNDAIITDNLGLVYACANRFKGKGIEYDDLFQAGCLGLTKAANKFDTERGVKFSTYAVPVILGEIKKLFRDGGTVKVGRTIKELSMKISRAANDFSAKEGRSPTIEELSKLLSVDKEKITEAIKASQTPLSLTIFESDSDDSADSQMDIPTEGYEDKLTDIIALRQIIKELNENDKKIIQLRFFKNLTQCSTAQVLNMTQVQISRREKKILALLRAKMTG
ncbi:MAG: sigma-70 family RNA polymerase sigma factor [Clostridiales bacterium]|nr:sigma-70 family RNA polymerase sigma factor [Clostridiales bacterium]